MVDNTTLPPEYVISVPKMPNLGDIYKRYLKLLRLLIKTITSIISFEQEIINVLLLLREALEKEESEIAERTGEL